MHRAERLASLDTAIERILARTGAHVVAAAPLGLGKPNRLLNALYRRIAGDPARSLELFTALSLARPEPAPGLARRFAGPFLTRHFGADYPDLEYVLDLRRGRLPPNVRIHEFYFQSGAWLGVAEAQRQYASINYTHVARDLVDRGVNLVVQLVARRGDRLSLASNTDVTFDLLDRMRSAGRPRPLVVFAVHPEMPFVGNHAEVDLDFPDLLLEETVAPHRLFALPRGAVAREEFALGLNASRLVRDGGTLQIGIGALSDALVHALKLRHEDNATWREVVGRLAPPPPVVDTHGGDAPFARGLYGASEMVMDGFMHLRRAGILKRRVFDDLGLQRLLNAGVIGETCDGSTLERLLEAGLVATPLDRPSVEWMVHFGILPEGSQVHDGMLSLPDGRTLSSDLLDHATRHALAATIEGRRLRNGRYLHGAFFLGSHALYDWLRALDGEDFEGFDMTRVSDINELYGGRELLDVAQRHQARFFNTAMMATLLGAAVSDGLEDGRVVSGVGGQYNFVAMAHALPDARSIILVRATRESGGQVTSSILYRYGHVTIPRHLRDLVVTEYGIADLRGQHDEAVIERMLAITDARFIDGLVAEAKAAGKLRRDFVVPDAWRRNTPEFLAEALAPFERRGLFPTWPFGSDFDAVEERLVLALTALKSKTATPGGRLRALARGLVAGAPGPDVRAELARMGLEAPGSLGERLEARVLAAALRAARAGAGGPEDSPR
jgi:acyl-CoA hydrolase